MTPKPFLLFLFWFLSLKVCQFIHLSICVSATLIFLRWSFRPKSLTLVSYSSALGSHLNYILSLWSLSILATRTWSHGSHAHKSHHILLDISTFWDPRWSIRLELLLHLLALLCLYLSHAYVNNRVPDSWRSMQLYEHDA